MIEARPPADAVILNDPNNVAGGYSAALVADMKQSLDVWMTHLSGLGTLTVSLNLINQGQNGLLANGGPTLNTVPGTTTPDGRLLAVPSSIYELQTGQHMSGTTSDITINVNTAYLPQIYLGGGTSVPSNMYDGLSLFEHEIAHGLGFGGFTSQTGTISGNYETLWDADLANINGTEVFTGANAKAANGGQYVNVTTLNNGEGYGHLTNSSSDPNANDLMTGLGLGMGEQRSISAVDLAILADVGAPIVGLNAATAATPVTGQAGTVTIGGTSALLATVGIAKSLGSLTLADTGAFTSSTVTLTATSTLGKLSATAATGATTTISADGHTATLTGSLAGVKAELATLAYNSATVGSDTVAIAVVDSYGNTGSGSMGVTTTLAPKVLSVATTPDATGPLNAGHGVTFTLSLAGPVSVSPTGTIGLALNDGATAVYNAAASTSTSLVFTTTVAANQNTTNLTATGLTLSGGATITNVNGTAANLSLSAATGMASGIVVDTTAPTLPTLILPTASDTGVSTSDHITKLNTPALSGTAEANTKVVISDTFGGSSSVLGTTTAGSNGAWTLTTPTLADGAHGLKATATDAAGNTSTATTAMALTIDTAAPSVPTLSLAVASDSGVVGDGITKLTNQILTGSADTGSSVSVYDGTTLIGTSIGSVSGAWSLNTSLSPYSAHSLTASASDVAGNVSAKTAAFSLKVDNAAPNTPTLGLAASTDSGALGDGYTNATTQTLTGMAEAGSTVTLYDGATQLGTITALASGMWNYTSTLASGSHAISASASDVAGNVSGRSNLALVIDSAAPNLPTMLLATSSDSGFSHTDGITNVSRPTISGVAEAGSTVVVTDTNAAGTISTVGAMTSSGSWSMTTPVLSQGLNTLSVTATDKAGNVSQASALTITLDTVAPVAPGTPVLAAASDSATQGDDLTNATTQTLTGTAEAGSTIALYDGYTALGTTTADFTGNWSYAAHMLNGTHTVSETATDAAGNISTRSGTLAVKVDTLAPNAPTLVLATAAVTTTSASGGINNGKLVSTSTPTLSGTAEAGSVVTLMEAGALVGSAVASSTGSWTTVLSTPLSLGSNALTATSTDAAGNVSANSSVLNLTLNNSNAGTVTPSALSLPGMPVIPTLVTLNGTATQEESYTADTGSDFVIVNSGVATLAANASSTSSMTVIGNGGTLSFSNGGGAGTVVGNGSSAFALKGGLASSTLVAFTGHAATTYVGGAGKDEVISGGGAMTLTGGTGGNLLVFGGAGTMTFTGGAESDMVIGGSGAETIHAGSGAVFAGTGGSKMFANGAGTFLAGNVSGDQLTASGVGGDILAAGSGNETLSGAGSTGSNLIFGGAGSDSISLGLGADTLAAGMGGGTIQAGAGNATIYLAAGAADLINFTSGTAGGTDTISGFRVGTDHLRLTGYAKTATPTLTAAGGSTTVGLTDGTRIVLSGVAATTTVSLFS